MLRQAYEAYSDAFFHDLNHFYPGLVALQMATILLDLSKDAGWSISFPDDESATNYKKSLQTRIDGLRVIVPISTRANLNCFRNDDPGRFWAKISDADVRFLVINDDLPLECDRVVNAYQQAIPKDKPFAWDAAKGQLELFAQLGIREKLASKVISAIDPWFDDRETERPEHMIVFGGHRIDMPGRPSPRFPPDKIEMAKSLIKEALEGLLDDKYVLSAMASAAPGADILFHQTCDELSIPRSICLPMPSNDFVDHAFGTLDHWREHFYDLRESNKALLELSNREGLPAWMQVGRPNAWERGNEWVINMAVSSKAKKVTLVALWDGENYGEAPGGTAHMVGLARKAKGVRLNIIDARRLLE